MVVIDGWTVIFTTSFDVPPFPSSTRSSNSISVSLSTSGATNEGEVSCLSLSLTSDPLVCDHSNFRLSPSGSVLLEPSNFTSILVSAV